MFKDNSLDFAFIDGIERLECAVTIRDKVKPGGIIVVDNTDAPFWGAAELVLPNWEQIKFKGKGSGGPNRGDAEWMTTVFIKPEP